MFFISRVPQSLVVFCGRCFGGLVFRLAGGERRKTLQNIKIAYGDRLSEPEVHGLGLNTWKNLGRNLFEVIHWTRWSREKIASQVTRSQGLENAEKAAARKKGFFVVTAHLGNWELLGGYLSQSYKGSALAQKLYDPRFDEIVNRFRYEKLGATRIIKRGLALRGVLEALKDNQFILALVDQDTGQDGVFVPFFGKLAWTQSGVARIARKTGAAIVPAFMVRGLDGRFEMYVEPEIRVPHTSDAEKDVVEAVRRYTEVIETYVKAYPDQWVWMHERWKTRPPGEKSNAF